MRENTLDDGREATCVRRVLVSELAELRTRHGRTPVRLTGKRVALARRIKDAERELEAFDRSRAEQIRRGAR